MRKLFECANAYLEECDWKDLALLKFCMCAVGIMIGLCVPKEKKKYPFVIAGIVFAATYIPLMGKYVKTVRESFWDDEDWEI